MFKVKGTTLFILLFCLIFIMSWTIPAAAAELDFYSTDVFVLMDSSNSMLSTDPDGLRFKAFENMAGQLVTGDRIGLFQFGYASKLVYPLTEVDEGGKDSIISRTGILKENMIYTDVKRVLNDSYKEMLKSFDSEHFPFFIMLTDGCIQPTSDFNRNTAFKNKYITELKAAALKYKEKNWPIYVVNIGKNEKSIDPDLADICKLTGGYALNISSPDALDGAFGSLLKEIRRVKDNKVDAVQKSEKNNVEPELVVTSPEKGLYRISGNIDIRTEIWFAGRRFKSNTDKDFSIKEFYVSAENSKGIGAKLDLKDDGAVVNGDTRKSDGIYSASLKPDCQGSLKLCVYLIADYKGTKYSLRKDIKGIEILPAGSIDVSVTKPGILELARGKGNYINLVLNCRSEMTESVVFSAQQAEGITITDTTFYLNADSRNEIRLELNVGKNIPVGKQGEIIIKTLPVNSDTAVTPASLKLNYRIVGGNSLPVLLLIMILLFLALLAVLLLLRKKRAGAYKKVEGVLSCWSNYDSSNIRKIKLEDINKQRIRISSIEGVKPDILLDGPEDIDFEVYSEHYNSETLYYVTAGINNIIYVSDLPNKTVRLSDEINFNIRSYRFSYSNPNIQHDKAAGSDILGKYDI